MSSKLGSDKEFRDLSLKFFEAARDARCTSTEEVVRLMKSGRGFRSIGSVIFAIGPDIWREVHALVTRATDLLGPTHGNEKDIEELAWQYAAKTANGEAQQKAFIAALDDVHSRTFVHYCPNYSIRFDDGIREFAIGPVKARLSEDVAEVMKKDFPKAKFRATAESFPGTRLRRKKIYVGLTPVCWEVRVSASKGNVPEEASWLINTALSLLRLSYPIDWYKPYFPGLGDCEALPTTRPETRRSRLTLTPNGASIGGWSVPLHYQIDKTLLEHLDKIGFDSLAAIISAPPARSLAERVARGLGWLTRGRQVESRSERFLYFFTAIEALLSNDDKSAPIIQTIARNSATILADAPADRFNLAKDIQRHYESRSALAHTGSRPVSHSGAEHLQAIAEALYVCVFSLGVRS
jgi:Apea-like HEPN